MKPSWVLIVAVAAAGCASRPEFEPYQDPYSERLIFKADAAERRSDWWLMGIGGALAAGAVVLLSGDTADAPAVPLTPPGDSPAGAAPSPEGHGRGRGKDKDKDKD